MKTKTIAVVAVIALVLTAGAATAMPGSAPDHAAGDDKAQSDAGETPDEAKNGDASNDDDARDEDAANDSDADGDATTVKAVPGEDPTANASAHADGHAAASGEKGPVVDLPSQVPSHVEKIHSMILEFLQGDGDGSLGESVSDVTAADAPADADDGNATATPDA